MDTNPSIVVIINFTPSISLVIVVLYSDTVPQSDISNLGTSSASRYYKQVDLLVFRNSNYQCLSTQNHAISLYMSQKGFKSSYFQHILSFPTNPLFPAIVYCTLIHRRAILYESIITICPTCCIYIAARSDSYCRRALTDGGGPRWLYLLLPLLQH